MTGIVKQTYLFMATNNINEGRLWVCDYKEFAAISSKISFRSIHEYFSYDRYRLILSSSRPKNAFMPYDLFIEDEHLE